jgi:DNA-binding LytR/AlgR family response regulator
VVAAAAGTAYSLDPGIAARAVALIRPQPLQAKAAAQRVVDVHRALVGYVRPGLTLAQIDTFVAKQLESLGAKSCFLGYRQSFSDPKFPSHACLSVNDCIVHGTACHEGAHTVAMKAAHVARLKAQLAAPGSDITALVAKLGQVLNATPAPAQEHLTFIRAAAGNNVRMVPVAEVCYFQATDKYVSVITGDAELLIRTSLRDLLAQLPPTRFRQIHRGTIVNLDWVSSAARDESGRVSLKLKGRSETLAVSRVFAEQFRPM